MTVFEFTVKLTKYERIKIQASDIETAKKIISGDLKARRINFEFVEIEDTNYQELKPQLLNESEIKFLIQEGETVKPKEQ